MVGDQPLKQAFPYIFNIAREKNASMVDNLTVIKWLSSMGSGYF